MYDKKKKVNVLFVCMGNICRSPAAEAILKSQSQENHSLNLYVESCGLGDWHVGRPADTRMKEACASRGIPLTGVAQQFSQEFLDRFDYILAADNEVLQHLYRYARTPKEKSKICLMTKYSLLYADRDVPDPYYDGLHGFEVVLDMLEDSCKGLVDYLGVNTIIKP